MRRSAAHVSRGGGQPQRSRAAMHLLKAAFQFVLYLVVMLERGLDSSAEYLLRKKFPVSSSYSRRLNGFV
jgi:hypothetical protein